MVVVEGTDAVQHIAFGKFNTPFGTVRVINLNSYEGSGLDADVFMTGVEDASVFGYGGSDTITGDGGDGTGLAYDLRLTFFGGNGNDYMRGGVGNDRFYAGKGADDVFAMEGNDYIDLQDGVEENDAGQGGPGADTCLGDPGDLCAP
jgi:Ca2+-binding RTX toxin-like protein